MRRLWLLLSVSTLPLAACASVGPVSQSGFAKAPAQATAGPGRPAWRHLASDVPVDPAIRFGQLPNGMRYAIMKNATPPGEASVRLRIDAGSLNERDDQRGVAHFLEHMVLNGTRNVPEGEFVKRLERAGLRFGPDTNASTDFEQTVFKLDLPKNDAATIDEALFLLREVADEASLEAAAIDSERGIILSEERTRGTPGYRVALDEYGFVLKGQRLPTRFPIGDTEVIRTAPRERFVEFYNGFYRPERATLVVVGDIDVDAMEAKIRGGFASWSGEGPALDAADQGTPAKRGREARLFVQTGVPSRVTLNWVRPADTQPDSVARRRETTIEQLALRVLNRRLQRIAAEPNPPFAGAGAGIAEDAETAERTTVVAVAAPGKWQDALAAITAEQRRFVQYGIRQGELQREIVDLRSSYTTQVAGAATRNSRGLAEGLVAAVNDDQVVTTPASQLARFEATVKDLTAEAVNATLPALFAGSGPLVYMTSPTPVAGDERALLAAYEAATRTAVAAPVALAAKGWPYEAFGTPGAVVERRELPGLGATAVRFANGTRLTVKPTTFQNDQILVGVRFGNGRLDFPNNGRASPEWGAGSAVTEGGVGRLTWEEVKETLTPNVVGVSFGVDDDNFSLGGNTRPEDFGLQMKLLTAYYTDPAWRSTGWDRGRSLADTVHDGLEATPGGIFNRDAGQLLVSGDSRWKTPSRAEMKAMDVSVARALIGPRFGRAPVEMTIVGDVTVDEAIRQTAATFGALPAGQSVPPTNAAIRFPTPAAEPVRLVHKGRADQGMAYIAWPTTGFYGDVRGSRTLTLLSDVLQLRLIAEIREKQGTTYSPSVGHSPSTAFADYGYLSASIQAPPEKLAGFLADAQKIARDLRDTPVTADELDRARRPSLASIKRARGSSNGWWLGNLARVQADPRVAASIASQIADYESVTPADLQRFARRYLGDARAWKVVVVPEAPAAASR
jgi:zinc protease